MLPHPGQVNKSQVNDLDAGVFSKLLYVIRSSRHSYFSFRLVSCNSSTGFVVEVEPNCGIGQK
jgi:hypothetical protein